MADLLVFRSPFVQDEVEVWPIDLTGKSDKEIRQTLVKAEYTVFKKVQNASKLKAVLNEKDIPTTDEVPLPQSYRPRIVPEPTYSNRKHTILESHDAPAQAAELAKIITERKGLQGSAQDSLPASAKT